MDMSDVVFEAFLEHLRAHFYREFQDEMEASERAAWEPIRRQLQSTRNIKPWAEVQAERRASPQKDADAQPNLREAS